MRKYSELRDGMSPQAKQASDERYAELLRCGHPKSSLYVSKYTIPEGECVDCGAEYLASLALENKAQ